MLGGFPQVLYASTSEGAVAFEALGDGPPAFVMSLGLCGNVELAREIPFLRRWLERLGALGRVVHYDRIGTGLSDRDLERGSPQERMDDIRLVMDAADVDRAVVVASLDGGPAAMMFAATYPRRVSGLVLYETFARVQPAVDYDVGIDPKGPGSLDAAINAHWGSGEVLRAVIGDVPATEEAQHQLARLERNTSSRRVAIEHAELAGQVDVRSVLPLVRCPSLVLWRQGLTRYRPLCSWLGDHLPRATAIELRGLSLHSWRPSYEDDVLDCIETFVTGGAPAAVSDDDRVLTTILFTDVVDSTRRASDLRDAAWTQLLGRHEEITRDLLHRYRGQEIKTTGDGFLASFDGPARAVRCAQAITAHVRTLGIEVRAGLHSGECVRRGDGDLAGVAVHIAARVCSLAGPSEVFATGTVRDLVVGSDLAFDDKGSHDLKGVDGRWPIVALRLEP